MEYKITDITGDYEAQFGKRRVTFKVEGNENIISGFFKQAPVVGESLSGDIVANGKYWNFKESKATFQKASSTYQPAPDALRVERKVDALMTEIQMMRGVMGEILQKIDPILKDTQPF